jgi:hypothetical protein
MKRSNHFTLTFGVPSVAKKVLSIKCFSAKSIHTFLFSIQAVLDDIKIIEETGDLCDSLLVLKL